MSVLLPFGKTNVSEATLRETIDLAAAEVCLEAAEIEQPNAQLDSFLSALPDLLEWLETNGRDYPWRHTSDAWSVYLAEILLQRTRGDAVAEIYDEFLEHFPTPKALYEAHEAEIRNQVYSLGFVNHRTRTLQEIGELFVEEHGEEVPDSLEELKRPWRAGEYSARACQLFARGEPLALVDSNFARVISRVFGYDMPTQPHKSDAVYDLMTALVPDDPPLARAFNLAILDLGAKVCTPDNPDCADCPLQPGCDYATRRNQTTE